jgi:hypothetical protein
VKGGAGAINFLWVASPSGSRGEIHIEWVKWSYESCSEEMLASGECVPFLDNEGILFTTGYALTLLIFLPMALMDLKVRTDKCGTNLIRVCKNLLVQFTNNCTILLRLIYAG